MAITVTTSQVTGPATAAGTQIGTQTLAAPASWTKLTTLGTIPTGGCKLVASSNAEAFRIAIVDPEQTNNAAAADREPRTSGVLVPWPSGGTFETLIPIGTQVWVKQA